MANDRVNSLMSLFQGRTDAYGIEKGGKVWAERRPVSTEQFQDHVAGKIRLGIYPVNGDNTTHWATIDFDTPDKARVEATYAKLVEKGFFPHLEASRSKGYHIWIFFDAPVKAELIRKTLCAILHEAGVDGIEVFPKQGTLKDGELGNYVFLPLNGTSLKNGRTAFLKVDFTPYEDQWAYLHKIHLTKTEKILEFNREYPEEVPKQPEPRMMPAGDNGLGSLDVERYLNHHGVKYSIKQDAGRTLYRLERCFFADQHTTKDIPGDSCIIQGADGKLGYQCFHAHCQSKTWQDARKVISGNDAIIRFFDGYIDRDQKKSRIDRRGEGRGLSEILSQPATDESYLTKPVLSRGDKGFVVSTYKTGKTLFLTQWTLALSMGTPFLGMEIPEPAKVLYVRFELKEHRFQKRLRLMLDALGGIDKVRVEPVFELVRGFNITNEKDFDWLLSLIKKHRADCLMLDPLYKMVSLDLKDTGNAMPLIRRFDSIMELNPSLAIVIAHHLRKQTGDEKESWDSTYGPMFFFADMDFEIRIKANHRKDSIFRFDHISNDVPVESFSFKRNPETLTYHVVNPETDHLDEILDHVQAYKGNKTILKDWIMESFGFSRREAVAVIDRMLNENKIRWDGSKTKGSLVLVDVDDTYHLPLTTGK